MNDEKAYLYFHFYAVSKGQNTESHGKVLVLVAGWSSQLSIEVCPNTWLHKTLVAHQLYPNPRELLSDHDSQKSK